MADRKFSLPAKQSVLCKMLSAPLRNSASEKEKKRLAEALMYPIRVDKLGQKRSYPILGKKLSTPEISRRKLSAPVPSPNAAFPSNGNNLSTASILSDDSRDSAVSLSVGSSSTLFQGGGGSSTSHPPPPLGNSAPLSSQIESSNKMSHPIQSSNVPMKFEPYVRNPKAMAAQRKLSAPIRGMEHEPVLIKADSKSSRELSNISSPSQSTFPFLEAMNKNSSHMKASTNDKWLRHKKTAKKIKTSHSSPKVYDIQESCDDKRKSTAALPLSPAGVVGAGDVDVDVDVNAFTNGRLPENCLQVSYV